MAAIIYIERLQKLYAKFSIPELLLDHGIENDQLILQDIDLKINLSLRTTKKGNFTPLWYYDSTEFNNKNADKYILKNDYHNGQLPATVYLPINSNDGYASSYDWVDAHVFHYNSESNMYSVIPSNKNSTELYIPIEVPRTQIYFREEDPREFVKRIKDAILRRDFCEKIMLWHMYMDKIKIDDISFSLSNKTVKNILNLIDDNKYTSVMKADKRLIVDEIQNNHKRSEFSFLLQYKIKQNPEKFDFVQLPNFEFGRITRKLVRLRIEMMNYTDTKIDFLRYRLIAMPEICSVLWHSNIENISIMHERLFMKKELNQLMTLEEFEHSQLQHIFKTLNLLKIYWVKQIVRKCRELRFVERGWFNILSNDEKGILNTSNHKLRKLMILIMLMMEKQLSAIYFNSAKMYADLIEQPCVSMKDINDDFSWGSNLYNTSFVGNAPPIFSILLSMNEHKPYYTTDPDIFETVIVKIFQKGTTEYHAIPAVHQYLLTNKMNCLRTNLLSMMFTNEISELQIAIENNIRLAIIPLKAYCKEFIVYLPLFNKNVQSYVKAFFEGDPSLIQIEEEIARQIEMKENLNIVLPKTIAIGPFLVNVELLKKTLVGKRNDLANLIMETHASITTDKLESCCTEFKGIYLKLTATAVSVEQVFETREWIDSLPTIIENLSDIVKRLFLDLDILNTFLWEINGHQFQLKTDALIWPYKIDLKIKESLQNVELEIEKFEKLHFDDELVLQDQIEYISSAILKLTIENDLSKVLKIAVDVNKNWKFINDLHSFGLVLNRRQKMFGHTVTPYENIDKLMVEFEPYKELWLSSAEFLKLQSSVLQNPLANLEESYIESECNDLLNIMTKCVEQFAEVPGSLSVAEEIKTQMEDYKPMVVLLKYILNPGMKQKHWDALARETGVKVTSMPSLNFKKCLDSGVANVMEQLRIISNNAWEEYLIEMALNKMLEEWNHIKLELIPHENTDIYIVKFSDKEKQMLDDHVLLVQKLSTSLFREDFEEQLPIWEEDLRLAQDIISALDKYQKKWMDLKISYNRTDIKEKLPMEYKKFVLAEQIWKLLMKTVLKNPLVMKIVEDKQFMEKITNGDDLLNMVQCKLSIYLETLRTDSVYSTSNT